MGLIADARCRLGRHAYDVIEPESPQALRVCTNCGEIWQKYIYTLETWKSKKQSELSRYWKGKLRKWAQEEVTDADTEFRVSRKNVGGRAEPPSLGDTVEEREDSSGVSEGRIRSSGTLQGRFEVTAPRDTELSDSGRD